MSLLSRREEELLAKNQFSSYAMRANAAVAKLGVSARARTYFVSSTLGSDTSPGFDGKSPDRPLATVGKALSYVEAASDGTSFTNDATIFLLPEHAETISAASALSGNTVTGLYLGVAGTKVIGLGSGAQRPKFTFATSTAADIEVAAADCRIENVVLESDVDTLVTAVTVAAGADGSVFKDVELSIATITSTAAPVDWFTVAAAANNLTFDGIKADYTETGTDSIITAGAVTGLKFLNADLNVTFDSGEMGLDTAGSKVTTNYGTPDGTTWEYFVVTADGESATWNTVAAHEIATVSGQARLAILPECTESLTDAGSGTIELGVAGGTATLVAQTTAADIDAGEYWLSTTPATNFPTTSLVDEVINNVDVGYTVGTGALTDGTLRFHIWAKPIGPNSVVGIGAGGSFA